MNEKITLCNIKKVQKSSWNEPYCSSSFTIIIIIIIIFKPSVLFSLQCFDAVGWAAGRASGL